MKTLVLLIALLIGSVVPSFALLNLPNIDGNAFNNVAISTPSGTCVLSNEVNIDGLNSLAIYIKYSVSGYSGYVPHIDLSPNNTTWYSLTSTFPLGSQTLATVGGISYTVISAQVGSVVAKRIRFRQCGSMTGYTVSVYGR